MSVTPLHINLNSTKLVDNKNRLNDLHDRVNKFDNLTAKLTSLETSVNEVKGRNLDDINKIPALEQKLNTFATKEEIQNVINDLETQIEDVIMNITPRQTGDISNLQNDVDTLKRQISLLMNPPDDEVNNIRTSADTSSGITTSTGIKVPKISLHMKAKK